MIIVVPKEESERMEFITNTLKREVVKIAL